MFGIGRASKDFDDANGGSLIERRFSPYNENGGTVAAIAGALLQIFHQINFFTI